MNFNKKEQFLNKRICGLWLIWIAFIILASAAFGGRQQILPEIFYPGYVLGIIFILNNKSVYRMFSFGRPTQFQKRMTFVSILFMMVLMVLISGKYYAHHDYRMVWLGAFLAIALHFIPFSTVHGNVMVLLAIPLFINAMVGFSSPNIPFREIAYVDALIKFIFGAVLFRSKNPLRESRLLTRR
ncbi:DUF6609 family protein [Paenibacillus azoreducens]|uniref:Uncharacterized protein n=1 Tax=Paenibacillus azoreducens TaxID=116718 RepID=A0A920CQQ9_9BACL|nr:DUF6609 family protein [Paenibacillus azoreducens]GIO46299.1 hypothetical protein J34TS1_10640 [Paenibacillus azoreducens]